MRHKISQDEVASARKLFIGLVMLSVAIATQWLYGILLVDGISKLEICLLCLFAILFAWIAASFWFACFGACLIWRGTIPRTLDPPEPREKPDDGEVAARTVIVMPIYNEDVSRVFAGIQAMYESLRQCGAPRKFDFFILSDTTDPDNRKAEELAWLKLRRGLDRGARVFYRHRPKNIGRKSGNIADFCERWGASYEYMVVLDADSLMTGTTLARLVDLMDANPRAALIQVPPRLVGQNSIFARVQQFAVSIYGPLYTAGLACLFGDDSNYWGHNAIIRVAPFTQHCGLPTLPGPPPLGGEILSHDFVEAALLRRAGWKICLEPELSGSFEETPPTIIDHLKRDQRWCQGNMQHLWLLAARGLHPSSRSHFLMGAMSYLSSPLWLLFLIVSSVETFRYLHVTPVHYFGRYPVLAFPVSQTLSFVTLVVVAAILLIGPKLIALFLAIRDGAARRGHRGALNMICGVFLETTLSTLLAPVFMLTHSWFVLNVLLGRNDPWHGQQRDDRHLDWKAIVRLFLPHTILGAAAGVFLYCYAPSSFWWTLPVIAAIAVAIPLAAIISHPGLGRAVRRWGLFATPSEIMGLPVRDRMDELLASNRLSCLDCGEWNREQADLLHTVLSREYEQDSTPRRSAA